MLSIDIELVQFTHFYTVHSCYQSPYNKVLQWVRFYGETEYEAWAFMGSLELVDFLYSFLTSFDTI